MFSPTLSPDGRWLAYEWRRENKNNIYVDPFPPTGVHHPVTTDGGSNPMWSPDGKRLFYVRPPGAGSRAAIDVLLGRGPPNRARASRLEKVTSLFSLDRHFFAGSGPGNVVDLSPDGKQFVTLLVPPQPDSESEQGQVSVVLNWFADLKQRAPVK